MLRSIRFPDEVARKVEAEADRQGRSFNWVVVQALEQALAGEPGGQSVSTAQSRSSEIRPGGAGSTPASPVASPESRTRARSTGPASARTPAMERQAKLNKAKGL